MTSFLCGRCITSFTSTAGEMKMSRRVDELRVVFDLREVGEIRFEPFFTLYAERIGYGNAVLHFSPSGATGAASWLEGMSPVVIRSYPPSPGFKLKSPMSTAGRSPAMRCAYAAASCEWMVITPGLRNMQGMW